MSEVAEKDSGEISLLGLASVLLRHRWMIAGWMLAGAALALLSVWSRPALYVATTSFIPQGSDASRSALAGLAGQLGVSIPQANVTGSPEFYTTLLKSRVILVPVARDTVIVAEMGGRRIAVMDLLKIEKGPTRVREEQAVQALDGIITPTVVRTTGAVQIAVATRWPSVSLALATALVNGVTEFNLRTRRGQAATEREFVEERLGVASADLREAEDRVQQFLSTNRQLGGSPSLQFERDRLQRHLDLKQQVFTSLTQAYEDATIREVRDTPGITMFEEPTVPTTPQPRGRKKVAILGMIFGGLFGALLSFLSAVMAHRRARGRGEADEFFDAVNELKSEVLAPVRWAGERMGRTHSRSGRP